MTSENVSQPLELRDIIMSSNNRSIANLAKGLEVRISAENAQKGLQAVHERIDYYSAIVRILKAVFDDNPDRTDGLTGLTGTTIKTIAGYIAKKIHDRNYTNLEDANSQTTIIRNLASYYYHGKFWFCGPVYEHGFKNKWCSFFKNFNLSRKHIYLEPRITDIDTIQNAHLFEQQSAETSRREKRLKDKFIELTEKCLKSIEVESNGRRSIKS